MESVFGTLFSVIFLKDVLTGKMLAGCALMFAAVLLSELLHVGDGLFRHGDGGKLVGVDHAPDGLRLKPVMIFQNLYSHFDHLCQYTVIIEQDKWMTNRMKWYIV